jgi:flagellar hook-basal body complex protein FliE
MMQDMKIQNQIQPIIRPNFSDNQTPQSQSSSFGKVLQQSIDQVNRLQLEADTRMNDLATGRQTDIHQTMIAVEKASVSFELLMQIRNKVITAYDKIMRTQV